MIIRVDPKSGVPIYKQIIEQFRYAVATETIKEGEQVPSIRELARELRVNPNTIARAYRELEIEGIIDAKQGAATKVSSHTPRLVNEERLRIVRQMLTIALARASNLCIPPDELDQLYESIKIEFGMFSAVQIKK